MTTLYIVGNGFDLWHGLPTSYGHFYDFARKTLDELEPYFGTGTSATGPWHDFESCLGTFDCDQFYDDHDNTDISDESFRRSHVYALEDELSEEADRLVQSIENQFHEWVEAIDVSVAHTQLTFELNARYLTFNYTSTLQLVYGINESNIVHIHGSSRKLDQLIFGHGETIEVEPELDANGE